MKPHIELLMPSQVGKGWFGFDPMFQVAGEVAEREQQAEKVERSLKNNVGWMGYLVAFCMTTSKLWCPNTFLLWGCLGYRCKNVQFGRWVEVHFYLSQLFAWSPPCLELFLPPKTSPCMMCTGSDPLPTSELGDPLGNNIYIYTQPEFLSSTYPRYRYIFMVYSVVNEILVIFVMCFLCVVPNLYPTFFRPEGSLRSCRAQVWTQPHLEGKHGRMDDSLAQTFLHFPHLFLAGNESESESVFLFGRT